MQKKPGFVLLPLPEELLNLFNEKIRGNKPTKWQNSQWFLWLAATSTCTNPSQRLSSSLRLALHPPAKQERFFPAFLQTKLSGQQIWDGWAGIGKMGNLDARGLSRLLCLVTPTWISLTFDCLCCNEKVLRAWTSLLPAGIPSFHSMEICRWIFSEQLNL